MDIQFCRQACKPSSVPFGAATISLGFGLRRTSSGLPGDQAKRAASSPLLGLSFRWGLPCPRCYHRGGGLLHHHFTIAVIYPAETERTMAVYFLWRFPCLYRPLALRGTLPLKARTFLPRIKQVDARAAARPASLYYSFPVFPNLTRGTSFASFGTSK